MMPSPARRYDPDVAFTRALELYKAGRWGGLLCCICLPMHDWVGGAQRAGQHLLAQELAHVVAAASRPGPTQLPPAPRRPGRPLAVYLLRYDDSFESDRYQAAVVRERQVRASPAALHAAARRGFGGRRACLRCGHGPTCTGVHGVCMATPALLSPTLVMPARLPAPTSQHFIHFTPTTAPQVFEGLIKGKEVMVLPIAADRQPVR